MNAHTADSFARNRRRRARGFSLMELMIVVVITGVLAAIAIPTFSGYIHKSRTSEATNFLNVIKLRQEAYRAEFGSYLQYGAPGSPVVNPAALTALNQFIPDVTNLNTGGQQAKQVVFPGGNTWFNQLGAKPDGMMVRFGYMWAAGTPEIAATNVGVTPWGMSPPDHYFVAQARADLDGINGACTFEVSSFTRGLWFDPPKGWE